MNEYAHLINDYLCYNNMIGNNGFNVLSKDELEQVLHNLKPFEAPDMYSIILDKPVLLEHFEFDTSHKGRKGMKGLKEEAALMQRIENDCAENEWKYDSASYELSFQDWQDNFEITFDSHYKKIDTYIKNVQAIESDTSNNTIICFVIENKFSPLVNYKNRYIGELQYIFTKQFWEFFLLKEKVDFILFVGYCSGKPQVTYIDRSSFKNSDNLIDLTDENLSLYKLNSNEITMYGNFSFQGE